MTGLRTIMLGEKALPYLGTAILAAVVGLSVVGKTFFASADAIVFLSSTRLIAPDAAAVVYKAGLFLEGVCALGLVLARRIEGILILNGLLIAAWLFLILKARDADCGCFGDMLQLSPGDHKRMVSLAGIAWVSSLWYDPRVKWRVMK